MSALLARIACDFENVEIVGINVIVRAVQGVDIRMYRDSDYNLAALPIVAVIAVFQIQ